MKVKHSVVRVPILAVALLFSAFGGHANPVTTTLDPQSKLWLVGDSTLHAYTSTAGNLSVNIDVGALPKGTTLSEGIQANLLKGLEVVVPVMDMKSGKKQLDKNMQKALKAGEHPSIRFQLTDYKTLPPEAGVFVIEATGVLDVAGVEKSIDLEGKVTPTDQGVRIEGTKDLLMTDFNVKPPTVMGMIRTRDRVVIHFDLFLNPEGGKYE